MTRLFIPHLGTKIKLTKTWDFTLHCEYRNMTLWNLYNKKKDDIPWQHRRVRPETELFLPAGTVLTVDRIYIRKGAPSYDSITFRSKIDPYSTGKDTSIRFWVKLDDANKIEGEVVE